MISTRITEGEKTCRRCGDTKHALEFYAYANMRSNLCKKCKLAENNAKWRAKNPEIKKRSGPEDDKKCPSCGVTKPWTEFEKKRASGVNIGCYCSACKKVKNAECRKKYPRKNDWHARSKQADPIYFNAVELLRRAKDRAAKAGLPFDLTVEHVLSLIKPVCPILGIKINYEGGTKIWTDASPSLDRFKPYLGYVIGNVNVISWRANRIKMDATPEEAMKIAVWMADQDRLRKSAPIDTSEKAAA